MAIKDLFVEKKVERVLGLDISTQSLAWCLHDKDGPVEWGEVPLSGSSVFERLADGHIKVPDALEHIEYDMIVFEAAAYVNNKRTVILLAYSFGAMVVPLIRKGVKVEEVSAMVWQKFIGNKPFTKDEKAAVAKSYPDKSKSWQNNHIRGLRKQKTMDWVEKEYGIKTKNDNIADAIAIGHWGLKKFS